VAPFLTVVLKHFGFLESDYSFRRVEEESSLVRWESATD
jgi:hypothetical protein